MKKRILSILISMTVVASLLIGCGSSANDGDSNMSSSEKETLVVAMELAYPPFETKDAEGNPTGVSVDFAKAFGEYIGKEVVIENTAWDGLITSLQTDKADMVISSMTITEERKETVDFSDPYANALLGVLANIDTKIELVEDDLNQEDMKIAVKTGSTGYLFAVENFPNAEIIALTDESACVTEVAQGKADAFLYDQLTIYRNWQNNIDTTQAIFVPFQDVEYWGVAVKKGNTELVEQLNEFIAYYTAEGGFDELSEKYLAEEREAFKELGFKWFFDLAKE